MSSSDPYRRRKCSGCPVFPVLSGNNRPQNRDCEAESQYPLPGWDEVPHRCGSYDFRPATAGSAGPQKQVLHRKYACPPHGGFGLGPDRLTMLLLGTNTLKETMFLFRGPNRLTP